MLQEDKVRTLEELRHYSSAIELDVIKQGHEAEVHVQLLVAVE